MTTASKTVRIDSTVISATHRVSTILVREGGIRRYETAIIIAGNVLEPRHAKDKASALIEHDDAVALVRGWHKGTGSIRAEHWNAEATAAGVTLIAA